MVRSRTVKLCEHVLLGQPYVAMLFTRPQEKHTMCNSRKSECDVFVQLHVRSALIAPIDGTVALRSLPWENWHEHLSLTDGPFAQFPPNKLSIPSKTTWQILCA